MGRPGWIAAGGWLACLALTVGFVALALLEDGSDTPTQAAFAVLIAVLGMAQPTVGALIAVRRPGNAVGWLLLAGALAFAAVYVGDRYARFGGATLPGAAAVALAVGGCVLVGTALAVATVLVFPSGRLLSPRWRAVGWATGAMIVAGVVAHGLAPGPLAGHPGLTNPAGVTGIDRVREVAGVAFGVLQIGVAGGALASTVVRYRRAGPTERTQLKWFGYAVGLLLVSVLAGEAVIALCPGTTVIVDIAGGVLLATLLPGAIGVAVLRHGLFDIDRLIRRTVVYGLLWAAITAIYAGAAAALGLAAAGAELPIGAAIVLTIAATLLFDPARRRLERVADRLVFGDRPDRYRFLADFAAQLQATFALSEIAVRLAGAIRDGLDVGWVRVALSDGTSATAGTPPPDAAPDTVLPLVHAGSAVGRIETCGLTDTDRELLDTLGGHAALAVHNAGLAAELARRLDQIRTQASDLAASRARIVHAQDAERRRIERNIHDGAQQQLVALIAGAAPRPLRARPRPGRGRRHPGPPSGRDPADPGRPARARRGNPPRPALGRGTARRRHRPRRTDADPGHRRGHRRRPLGPPRRGHRGGGLLRGVRGARERAQARRGRVRAGPARPRRWRPADRGARHRRRVRGPSGHRHRARAARRPTGRSRWRTRRRVPAGSRHHRAGRAARRTPETQPCLSRCRCG